ncbi:long-chain-alcohol oxidase FAO1-like [Hibiscus syriacus]|uniref:Long-chain-alcohol oxidase FAO1-like n=1 Tax=Hibiscus syriacus TaxID=106335 RepID=A0A6A3BC93_HIBSY|nr:long-chain-alcohol oxidase FAO1-like [Hibiscus syriacus]
MERRLRQLWATQETCKKIKLSRQQPHLNHDLFCSVLNPIRLISTKLFSGFRSNDNDDDQVIKVRSMGMPLIMKRTLSTELLQLFSEEDDVRAFFESLDEELNKVNQFYKTKEREFLERRETLNQQLQILKDLKQVIDGVRRRNSDALSRSPLTSPRNSDFSAPQVYMIVPQNLTRRRGDRRVRKNGVKFMNSTPAAATSGTKRENGGKPKVAVRIDIPATTPTRTILAVTSMLWEDLINNPMKQDPAAGNFINRKKIQRAEKMIRTAFVELYRGLELLKTYGSLNMVAFTKILKKFDKEKSHEVLETTAAERLSHGHLFFGLFTGVFVSLLVYIVTAHSSGVFSPTTEAAYMETVYPVFSVFALLSLHLFLYGCNLLMWKKTRINYNFIFEFAPNTALKYRDAFLICTALMTSVVGALVIHLLLSAAAFPPTHVDTIPGILLLVGFYNFAVCPFDILYQPTRYRFLRIIRNIICSPLYKVLIVDFFMADQLTSQIPLLRYLESTACNFLTGSFKTHQYSTCKNGHVYRRLVYVISFSPYYWRAMQCAEDGSTNRIRTIWLTWGSISAMVAAGARLTYATQSNNLWNPWLRDDLILKKKSIYFISIVSLKCSSESCLDRKHHAVSDQSGSVAFVGLLLGFPRGHPTRPLEFYRLENEHLNNVDKFRAIKLFRCRSVRQSLINIHESFMIRAQLFFSQVRTA